jgi:hypothetical protein
MTPRPMLKTKTVPPTPFDLLLIVYSLLLQERKNRQNNMCIVEVWRREKDKEETQR